MGKGLWPLVVGVWALSVGLAWGQTSDPDLWAVDAGDPIEAFLDRSLFEGNGQPAEVAAVLDRVGDLAVINIGHVKGLVGGSSHVLDFAAGKAYHIRPWHVLVSARLSPDNGRIAAVVSEPVDRAIVIYGLGKGEGRRLVDVQATAGSVKWLSADRIEYLPWEDAPASSQPIVVDLSTAQFVPSASGPAGGVVPMVTCCGSTGVCAITSRKRGLRF